MGVGSGLYMYDVVVKRSRSLSHLLMSSCFVQTLTHTDQHYALICVVFTGPRHARSEDQLHLGVYAGETLSIIALIPNKL